MLYWPDFMGVMVPAIGHLWLLCILGVIINCNSRGRGFRQNTFTLSGLK